MLLAKFQRNFQKERLRISDKWFNVSLQRLRYFVILRFIKFVYCGFAFIDTNVVALSK